MSVNIEEVIIEILDDSTPAEVIEFNTGDVDLEVVTGATASESLAEMTTVIEVAEGIPGEGAGFQIVAQDNAPVDTSVLWLDTSP
jgi:hypothetical protein